MADKVHPVPADRADERGCGSVPDLSPWLHPPVDRLWDRVGCGDDGCLGRRQYSGRRGQYSGRGDCGLCDGSCDLRAGAVECAGDRHVDLYRRAADLGHRAAAPVGDVEGVMEKYAFKMRLKRRAVSLLLKIKKLLYVYKLYCK